MARSHATNAQHDPAIRPRTEAVFHGFLRTFGLLRQVMEPYFARFGISGPQWGILRVLQRAELHGKTDLRLSDLGQRLFIQPPGITGLIDRMERRGLVRRRRSRNDLRARRLRLTPLGRRLLARVLKGHAQQVESLFRALKPDQMAQMHDLLTRLVTHLQVLALSPRRKTIATPRPRRTRK